MWFRKHANIYNRVRLRLVLGFFGLIFCIIVGRLYTIQVTRHSQLRALASHQYLKRLTLRPERGRILDRHGRVLATSVPVSSVYAIPEEIAEPNVAATRLAPILEQPLASVRRDLATQAPFVWLARHVSPATVARLQVLQLQGVHFLEETRRYYPKRHLAGQVLGFVGIDEQGLGGLEYLFDETLSGTPHRVTLQRDAIGRRVRLLSGSSSEQPRGADIHLTLDERLQYLAEKHLAEQVQRVGAKSGLVLIMQPQTGDLLAIASYPFFNPNNFREPAEQIWQRNRAVTDSFEPGSTFKLVVAAASLEERTVEPGEVFFCENGLLTRGRRRIRDHDSYGFLSFPEIFEHSSNIGLVKLSDRLSSFTLYQYIRRFGFGEKSLVNLPGETPGQLRPPQQWSRFSNASLAIGQEITVTPLQLVTAFAAVANGGRLMRPRIVERIVGTKTTKIFNPEVRWRVVSQTTAEKLTAIFSGVVNRGTGRLAAVEGYAVAGKTGTAQKAAQNRRGYSHNKVITSFVGYAPIEKPQFVILVLVDEPRTARWGGRAAAPVFQRIAQGALHYLQIPTRHALALPLGSPTGQTLSYRRDQS